MRGAVLAKMTGSSVAARELFDVRRYDNHPIYDMVYIAVAEAARTTLITADSTLRARLCRLSWVGGLDA
jgi:predicted nucleic acid-binding protein